MIVILCFWSANFVISSNIASNQATTFAVIDKLFFPVASLSTQVNAKLFQQ